MQTKRSALDIVLLLAIVGLSATAWSQSARLAELNEQVRTLEARVDRSGVPIVVEGEVPTMSAAPGSSREPRERTVRASGDARVPAAPADANAAGMPDAVPAVLDVQDPEVRMKLRDVIAEEQQVLREQRWAQRQERREERVRERIQQFAQDQDVDEGTTLQIEDLMAVEVAEISDIFRNVREGGGDWSEAREKIPGVRAETDKEVKELLSKEQYEAYEAMRAEERDDRRGRRGSGNDQSGERRQNRER